MTINLDSANAFLAALGDDAYIFQTFTDSKKLKAEYIARAKAKGSRPFDPLARVYTGTFKKCAKILEAVSKQGAGIFVQINAGKERGKKHVTRVRSLFIDLDEPATASRSIKAIKKYMPKPTIVTQSSQGKYHFYWQVVDCQIDQFIQAQKSLAIKFNSDPTVFNLDRVMRLPGFPHQKNMAKPQMVKCQTFDELYTYKEIHDAASKAPNSILAVQAEVPAPPRIGQKPVSDVFGLDMSDAYEAPTELKAGARTQVLVQHIGALVAQGYGADAVRTQIIDMNNNLCAEGTDPIDLGILEVEVLGCIKSFIAKRDLEVLQRDEPPAPPADGEVPPPPLVQSKGGDTLEQWLDRFRYIQAGSRIIDTSKKGIHATYSLQDFKNATSNVFVGKKAKLFHKWFQSRYRQDVRDTIFYPSETKIIVNQGEELWNTYSPSDVIPAEVIDISKIDVFNKHINYMFPNKQQAEIFWSWMAATVQNLDVRIPWAPLIISKQGVGKGFIFQVLQSLLGFHNCAVILPERLESQFNSYMEGTLLICIDEMKANARVSTANKLKSCISETTVEINTKGVSEHQCEIFANTIIFTNHYDAAEIEDSDRRFWVVNVEARKKAPKYYKHIFEWAKPEAGNIAHLYKYLLEYDISKFEFSACPNATTAKIEMMDASKSHYELEVVDAVANRDGLFGADIIGFTAFKDYIECSAGTDRIKMGTLRSIYASITQHLPNCTSGITANASGSNARQRVRCIRNFEYWSQRSHEDLKYELTRAIQLSNGVKDVLPPKLEVVSNGDTNAQSDSS